MKFDLLFEEIIKNEKNYVIVAGIHGDEPAGNLAVKAFQNKKNIHIISNINKTHKRRFKGKDLNRHFDSKDSTSIQDNILNTILKINPILVIDLHEDCDINKVYAYCSPDIKEQVKKALSSLGVELATKAYGDKTDGGVISKGKQPYKHTLERALRKRNIPSCTIETPSSAEDIQLRANQMIKIINYLMSEI